MSNANEPAYPAIETRPGYDSDRNLYAESYSVGGLTKREYAAIAAMQAYVAGGFNSTFTNEELAVLSAKKADALLAELERTK